MEEREKKHNAKKPNRLEKAKRGGPTRRGACVDGYKGGFFMISYDFFIHYLCI